jgi:hypothetical protein
MPNTKRDSKGRFTDRSWISTAKDHPVATAAIAAGAAGAAFLWTKRERIGETVSSGMDRLSEIKAQRMRSGRTQEEIAEEALTLKETGQKSTGSRGPLAQQDIKAGMAIE